MRKKSTIHFLVLLCFVNITTVLSSELTKVTGVDIAPEVQRYIPLSNRILTTPGLKQIRLEDGRCFLFCIAYTAYKGDTALDRQKMMTVCRVKALAEIQKSKSCTVHAVRALHQESIEVTDGTATNFASVSKLLNCTEVEVQGRVRSWPVVGTWLSADKTVFYLATGGLFDKDMNLISYMTE